MATLVSEVLHVMNAEKHVKLLWKKVNIGNTFFNIIVTQFVNTLMMRKLATIFQISWDKEK